MIDLPSPPSPPSRPLSGFRGQGLDREVANGLEVLLPEERDDVVLLVARSRRRSISSLMLVSFSMYVLVEGMKASGW